LSVNVTRSPVTVRAQPSGTLIAYVRWGEVYVTNAVLSGMSPGGFDSGPVSFGTDAVTHGRARDGDGVGDGDAVDGTGVVEGVAWCVGLVQAASSSRPGSARRMRPTLGRRGFAQPLREANTACRRTIRRVEARLLLVEDDESIGRSLTRTLEGQGYVVDWAHTGAAATDLLRDDTALVLLDLGLPDVDGVTVCERLRDRSPELDIVIVTARREEVDVVLGLDAGADDYIVKPFRLAELLARVNARLRRRTATDDGAVRVGALAVDLAARRAWIGDAEIGLRPKEFALLALLAGEAGHVVGRERIMRDVWDEHWFGSTKTLDIHMSSLRRKLLPLGPSVITTIRGVGYRLDSPHDDAARRRGDPETPRP
jgi:DNA-binding response OmpR family regulator